MNAARNWLIVGAASLFLHAGGFTYYGWNRDAADIAGGEGSAIPLLGDSLVDMVAGSTLEPVHDDILEASEPEPADPQREVIEQTFDAAAETDPSLTAQPDDLVTDIVIAVAPSEVQEIEALPDEAVEVIEPEPEATPKPKPKPRAAPKPPPKPKPQTTQAPKPRTPTARRQGNNEASAARGVVSGTRQGNSASSGNSGSNSAAGNAAVSRYPGKVHSRIARRKRIPSSARGKRGTVHVRFTVSSGGGASGIRVVRSSGVAALDRAALDAVRRAAPFPPIPKAAGKRSWTFTVPLRFGR